MRSVTYSMGVSLDGYIVEPDGDITAPPPDEEVWRLVTDEIREVGVHLMGRRLYETMLYFVASRGSLSESTPCSVRTKPPDVVWGVPCTATRGAAGWRGRIRTFDLLICRYARRTAQARHLHEP
jgi:hypothetical protein